jgi:tripartite-type tricarboxylate transporter receptor subunit TctC
VARTLGQPVVIENAVGAAGAHAGNWLIASPPEGQTILVGPAETPAAAVSLIANLRYQPVQDLAHVGPINTNPNFNTALRNYPANTLKWPVEWRKANEATGRAAARRYASRPTPHQIASG